MTSGDRLGTKQGQERPRFPSRAAGALGGRAGAFPLGWHRGGLPFAPFPSDSQPLGSHAHLVNVTCVGSWGHQWVPAGVGAGWAGTGSGFPLSSSPLPGRVARAGRSGTAYSLVAPDEMPYVFDLHLFLGRPLVLAGAQEMPAGEADLVAGIGVAACPSWDTGHVAAVVLPLASTGVRDLVVGIRAEGRYALITGVQLGKMGCWGLRRTPSVRDADLTPPSSPWLLPLLF